MSPRQLSPEQPGPVRNDLPGAVLGRVSVLDDTRPAGRDRVRPQTLLALLGLAPAAVLAAALIGWPVLRTAQVSVTQPSGRGAGLANFRAAFSDPLVPAALGRTVGWAVLVPVLVLVLGYLLAAASRRVRGGRVLVFALVTPMAFPLLVIGVVFRLADDPSPERGTVTAGIDALARLFGVDPTHVPALLGPTLITPALMSAFVWGFLGLVVVVFRVVLASIPAGREDMVRAEGGGSLDVFRDVRWPVLRRVTVVLFVLVALATARSFDLLLIMAPASVQNDGQTLSVYVWRASSGATPGTAAALSVVWLIVVGLAVAVALAWKRAEPGLSVPVPLNTYRAATTSGRSARGRVRLVAGRWIAVLAGAAWFLPLLLLAVTSLHSAPDAATRGWTAPLSFRGYLDAWRGLSGTLGGTAVLAGTVTLVVLSVAILAGYALVVFRPLGSRPASALLVAASVVPIQTIARPIDEVLGAVRLSGSGAALFLVHVAMGVPLITLLLRNAFEQLSLGGPAGTETVRGTAGAHRDTGRRGRREQVTGRPLGAGREAGRALMVAARPAVYAAAVLEFVQVWNDLVVGLLFGGSLSPVGVTLFGQARDFVSNAAALAAGSMLVSLPPLILVLLARKRVVDLLVYGVLT